MQHYWIIDFLQITFQKVSSEEYSLRGRHWRKSTRAPNYFVIWQRGNHKLGAISKQLSNGQSFIKNLTFVATKIRTAKGQKRTKYAISIQAGFLSLLLCQRRRRI